MPEGMDEAQIAFSNEIGTPERPRDQAGRFVQTSDSPEPMFGQRPMEESEEASSTDQVRGPTAEFEEEERRRADGWFEERNATGRRGDEQKPADDADQDAEGNDQRQAGEGDQGGDPEGQKLYEVSVGGTKKQVPLRDIIANYTESQTLQSRFGELAQAAQHVEAYAVDVAQRRDAMIDALQRHEAEYQSMIPAEPNWDELYKVNPQHAYQTQKSYAEAYAKRDALRQQWVALAQARDQENEARTAQTARAHWNEFRRLTNIPDDASFNNEVNAIRRYLAQEGFTPHEINTTYDKRMLLTAWKASQWDRLQARELRPVQPEKGRTLAPGSARPNGSTVRKGIDDALKRQAASGGRMDATIDVFRRLI